MIQPLFMFNDITLVLVRVFIGCFFLEETIREIKQQKLVIKSTKKNFFFDWAIILQLIIGIMLTIGFFTQIVSLFFIIFSFFYKKSKGIFSLFTHKPFKIIFLFSLLILVTFGGGHLSIDDFFKIIIY